MSLSIREIYLERRDHFARKAARFARFDGQIALARGIVFLIWLVLAVGWLLTGRPHLLWMLLPVGPFGLLIVVHSRVLARKRRAEFGVAYYDRCLKRLDGRWSNAGETGERYQDLSHPYASDLDIFGQGSLFQQLWRGVTRLGQDRLAHWLLTAASRETALARQQSVAELRDRHDLREAVGLIEIGNTDGNQNVLRAWAGVPPRPIPGAIRAFAVVLSVIFWMGLLAWLGGWAPVSLPIAAFAACLILTFFLRNRITEAVGRLDRAEAGLTSLAGVLRIAERGDFQTPMLRELRNRLAIKGVACSERIAELQRLSLRFNTSLFNQFFAPIAISFGLPIHLAHAAELWRMRFGAAASGWLDAVGEYEALLCLAGYAAENPEDTWPSIVESQAIFDGRRLGHPLLPKEHCVRNDIRIDETQRLVVVSGSNMAGKSTLLRAVGLNTVLAFAGAPVRAASLTISPLKLGSVIRVADSLQSGKSLFFSAIERLKRVAMLAGGKPPLLFLFDELLAGTNSHDRRVGAEAILNQLMSEGSLGIVTTHDLALTEIAEALAPQAINVHFRDVLVGDRMEFDYTLRPGVVQRGNAVALMRLIGLMPANDAASKRDQVGSR